MRALDIPQPSAQEARAVVVFLRGQEDFPHGSIDWLAVGRLGGELALSELRPREGTAPTLPLRAQRALEIRRAIVGGDRPMVRDTPASFETLGAVYFMLTAGQYTMECPNQLSPLGRHRWRFCESPARGMRRLCCDYCGEERSMA